MFLIDADKKKAISLKKWTFKDLHFSERQDLQEWICDNPEILGEKLLIIQKEFDGFSDTRERLDLLALDERGNLVIIENKLDDSGRDVVWQALKYVSYCAPLKKAEICDIYQKYLGAGAVAGEKLCEFFGVDDLENIKLNSGEQRMILVAANFRKEVTATVLFLNDHQLDIKCIKVTPYQDEGRVYLGAEQILPVQDVVEYQMRLSAKKQEDAEVTRKGAATQKLRLAFWEKAIPAIAEKVTIFQNCPATTDNYIEAKRHSGLMFGVRISAKGEVRVELTIKTNSKEENKAIFDMLFDQKEALEGTFGGAIEWERLPGHIPSRLFLGVEGFALAEQETWEAGITGLQDSMKRLYDALQKPLEEAMKKAN